MTALVLDKELIFIFALLLLFATGTHPTSAREVHLLFRLVQEKDSRDRSHSWA